MFSLDSNTSICKQEFIHNDSKIDTISSRTQHSKLNLRMKANIQEQNSKSSTLNIQEQILLNET